MNGHYPRGRLSASHGAPILRQSITLCFYMRRSHHERARAVQQSLDIYLHAVGPQAPARYAGKDEKASEVSFWRPKHGGPEKLGQYMGVGRLRIDKFKVGNAQVFRLKGWEVALIISEKIKDAMERMGATGTRFEEV